MSDPSPSPTAAPSNDAPAPSASTNPEPRAHRLPGKDPWSWLTHALGAVVFLVAGTWLVASPGWEAGKRAVGIIYVVTLVLLLGSSAAYHFFDLGKRGNLWLRRMDHSAIFLLIAGTYLVPLMAFLDGAWRVTMVAVISGIAIAGVIFKLTWFRAPRWLNAALYLAMGWLVVVPGPKIFPRIPADLLAWLVAGGAAYTLGAIIYARKKPDPWPGVFGFHEVWHLFVLAGASAHFVFVWKTLRGAWG